MFWLLLVSLFSPAHAQYTAYYGNLHAHTSYSDGEQTPAVAFAWARDMGHLDFEATTDHLEQIEIQPWNWFTTLNAADDATVDGSFVAIAGYEWGSPIYNHCNVFNTTSLLNTLTVTNWPAFCQDVIDARPAFAQFNHAGETITANDWNHYAYMGAVIDSAFPLIEVKTFPMDSFYRMALDSGWHVAAVYNQDNHSANWGTANDCRAGLWATALTRAALFEAIMARRTFSTWDKNASVWIDLDGHDMGSRIPRAATMSLHLRLQDPDGETWTSIEVIGGGGVTYLSLSGRTTNLDTTFTIAPAISKWLYTRVVQADGQALFSAPIWLTGLPLFAESPPAVTDCRVGPNPTDGTLRITGGNREWPRFYDLTGHSVDAQVLSVGLDLWDLSDLLPGTYLFRMGDVTKRIVLLDSHGR